VINTNLPPILHVSKSWLIIGQIFDSERGVSGVPHFNALAGWSLVNIAINDISLKTRFFGLHFRRRKYIGVYSTTFTQSVPKADEFGEIIRCG